MVLSFAVQTTVILVAAILVQTQVVSPDPDQDPTTWLKDLAIALISFQTAGQIIASKYLAFSEIPTVVLTALMCDLFLDKNLFQQPWSSNPKQNQKIGFVLALFGGALLYQLALSSLRASSKLSDVVFPLFALLFIG